MSTYVLIPGAGGAAWYWHRVVPLLRAAGHDAVAVDLPAADPSAGLPEYTETVLRAIDGRSDLIVVGQSLGGFTAPLVCARTEAKLLVLVAAMVPRPGESAGEWWANTGQPEAAEAAAQRSGRVWDGGMDLEVYFHDVPEEVRAEAMRRGEPDQSGGPMSAPWPLDAWPDVPTRFLLCRDDRLFPAEFQRRVVRERLGITPDEMRGGHLPALAHPVELVEWLEGFRASIGSPA